jgi:phosphatidylserine decarboxylase
MVNKNLLLIFALIFTNQAWGSDAIVPAQENKLELAAAVTDSDGQAKSKSLSAHDVEDTDNQATLEKLYQTKLGKLIREVQTKPVATKAAGDFISSLASRPMISNFLKKNPDVDAAMDNFICPSLPQGSDIKYATHEDEIKPYKTFNEFFYRKLSKKGMDVRPIAKGDNVMASPADCHLFVIPDLSQNPEFFVKGCKFDLDLFLKGSMLIKLNDPKWVKKNPKLTAKHKEKFDEREALVQKYKDGILLLFRLAPNDYHRFHFPFDCTPTAPEKINGIFESVNPIAYTPNDQPLTENLRHLIILKSPVFGDVLCMVVGAMMVGSINETYQPEIPGIKGQEMGYFAFGGSSIVLIFKKDAITIDQRFIDQSKTLLDYEKIKGVWRKGGEVDYPETKIKMGEKIGEIASKTNAAATHTDVTTAPLVFKDEWKLPEPSSGSVVFTVNQTNDIVVALSLSMQDTGGMQTEKIIFKPIDSPTTYWLSVGKGQDSQGASGLAGGYVWRWVIRWGMGSVVGQNELGNKTLSTRGTPYSFRYVGFGGAGTPDILSNITISNLL